MGEEGKEGGGGPAELSNNKITNILQIVIQPLSLTITDHMIISSTTKQSNVKTKSNNKHNPL